MYHCHTLGHESFRPSDRLLRRQIDDPRYVCGYKLRRFMIIIIIMLV